MANHSLVRDHARPSSTQESPRFTPGPWHEHSHRQIGPDAGIVCEVWSAIGWGDEAIQQADANVRLIAAAPELYAALQAIVDDCGQRYHLMPNRFLVQAREALQLAQEGRK